MDVKQRRYEKYLRDVPLDAVDIREGLGPWETEWSDFFEEDEGCENDDVHIGAHVFVQVDVATAPGDTIYDDDSDMTWDVDDEVNSVKPCAGRQYA
jgi:hypothetical protein